ELALGFPDSPPAELARFLARKSAGGLPKKAAPLVSAYLKWRTEELPRYPPAHPDLPMILRSNGHALSGSRILLMLPCAVDLAFKPEAYSHHIVQLLDAQLKREDTVRFTVLADVRGHKDLGFSPNSVFRIWAHVAALMKAFQAYFPNRLEEFVLYPAGDMEMGAFKMFKPLIAKDTLKRVKVLYSPLGCNAPTPPKELLEIIDPKEISPENTCFFTGLGAD
ncbi:unnamed protein product, partial [Polarella glacialis]